MEFSNLYLVYIIKIWFYILMHLIFSLLSTDHRLYHFHKKTKQQNGTLAKVEWHHSIFYTREL